MTRKETSNYIRNLSKTPKVHCYVCDTKKEVQRHHILKVEDLTHIAWTNNLDTKDKLNELYTPTVPLCDMCHKTVHSLMEDNFLEPDITYDTFLKVFDILNMVDFTEVPENLLQDYKDVYDRTFDTVIFNLLEYGEFTEDEYNSILELIKQEEEYDETTLQ